MSHTQRLGVTAGAKRTHDESIDIVLDVWLTLMQFDGHSIQLVVSIIVLGALDLNELIIALDEWLKSLINELEALINSLEALIIALG